MSSEAPLQAAPLPPTPTLFKRLLTATVLLASVPTLWPALDLHAAALFTGANPRISVNTWWFIELINGYVPAAFRVMVIGAFALWALSHCIARWQHWRLALAFVALAGTFGPGIAVNWGFKDHWLRARPYQVQNFGGTQQFTRATLMTDQCDNNCSFVSGHVACGVFFASLMLVHRRRQLAWTGTGLIAGAVIGFARMSDVAHWLSDVLWAYPITLASCWLVWRGLSWIYARKPSPTQG